MLQNIRKYCYDSVPAMYTNPEPEPEPLKKIEIFLFIFKLYLDNGNC